MFVKSSNERRKRESNDRSSFDFYTLHHAAHRVIYQLFIPFVIHEEKFGTNNHHLILLGIQSSSLQKEGRR